MAAKGGVDSVNFLRSSLSKRNVLVVGDGNFSFSLSLAEFRDEHELNSRLVLTSFDSREILKQDDFTRSNIERLQGYGNAEILHDIDATKLSECFPTRKFGRIIFNFPHTGGKSNIKECRKLLEDFFVSAAEHIDDTGDICVTLCKGQGGTPLDEPQRGHGNSWQIVYNAAKAGLILDQMCQFLGSDYAYYRSIGYRGKFTKGFHTAGGLIHIFKPGFKLDSIEDFSEKPADAILSHVYKWYMEHNSWSGISSGHPLHVAKNKICTVLNTLTGALFEEIFENNVGESQGDSESSLKTTITLKNRIFSAMKTSSSFFVTDTALALPEATFSESSISMRYLAIGRFFESERNLRETALEIQEIVDKLKRICSSEENGVESEYNYSEVPSWTSSSAVAHLARVKCQLKKKAETEQSITAPSHVKCSCQTTCQEYLTTTICVKLAQRVPVEFFHESTRKVLKVSSSVVIVCGCMKDDVIQLTGRRHGWLIFVNLDAFAKAQYNISDIRLLSSHVVQWEQILVVSSKKDGEETAFACSPTNLFPPEHVHDISFWISKEVSQELFFLTAIALTKNCVKEIKPTEIYHDESEHRLSFNYRMIYSRVDGPLSHLEAVQLQNNFRRALIVLGFGLK